MTRYTLFGALPAFAAVCCLVMGSGLAAAASDLPDPAPTPSPTTSQSTTFDTVPTAFSLTISPTRLAISASEVNEAQVFLVVNRGEEPVHVEVRIQSFLGGLDGSLDFQEEAPYSAAEWVAVEPASFTLQPGTSQEVEAAIVIPADAEPGDHQVALVFVVPAGDTEANIKINRGVAAPIYIAVAGSVDDSVQLSALSAPAFSAGGPIDISLRVENTGTVHHDFRGDTALEIQGTDSAVFPDFTVIRDSERVITTTWDPPFFCVCQLTVAVENADGTSSSQTVQTIVFPVVPAAITLGALILLGVLIAILRRRARANALRPAAHRRTPREAS